MSVTLRAVNHAKSYDTIRDTRRPIVGDRSHGFCRRWFADRRFVSFCAIAGGAGWADAALDLERRLGRADRVSRSRFCRKRSRALTFPVFTDCRDSSEPLLHASTSRHYAGTRRRLIMTVPAASKSITSATMPHWDVVGMSTTESQASPRPSRSMSF